MDELDVIDWMYGLIPMPQHLVDEGTKRTEYYRGLHLTEPIVVGIVTDATPVQIQGYEYFDLPEPYYEVRVWGELTERGLL